MGMSIYGENSGGDREKFPSAKLKDKGDTVKGVILKVSETSDKDFKTKKAKFWHSERKAVVFLDQVPADEKQYISAFMQFVFELDTVDGVQVVFANGRIRKAVVDAAKEAGATEFEPGGLLGIKVTDDDPRKEFKAVYVPPAE